MKRYALTAFNTSKGFLKIDADRVRRGVSDPHPPDKFSTLLTCYQQPDHETLLAVVSESRKVRERGVG